MILELSVSLLERLGIIVICAYMMMRTTFFKKYIIKQQAHWLENVLYGVFWGAMGILMTLMGEPVYGGIANSRTIPILLSGIIGGPVVGTIAGLISGGHRMFLTQGGYLTAVACGISTLLAGVIGGFSKRHLDGKKNRHLYGFVLGIVVEMIQMGIILLIARPYEDAIALVKVIFLPMTFLNAFGVSMFLLFIQQVYDEGQAAKAMMAELSLSIAALTLPYFRKGLNEVSALKAAQIIYDLSDFEAVSFTDKEHVLAHVGLGSDHHVSGGALWTRLTRTVLNDGEMMMAQRRRAIGCEDAHCPLGSVVIMPLKIGEQTVGTLKVYRHRENAIAKTDIELVRGLGILFSTQLELGLVEAQKKLRAEAELTALRAQIKPHFLFNALNAIMSLTRTDAEKARELLQELSVVLRNGFKNAEPYIPLEEELRFIEAYLKIECARFPEKLNITLEVDPGIHMTVPPLILQPLVENAVKHGIHKKTGDGHLFLGVSKVGDEVAFEVSDDGVGIPAEILSDPVSTGIGLKNVKERLKTIYGRELSIETALGSGTTIRFQLPITGGHLS
jgi:two-component system sensor histidine kinase LytS